MTPRLHNCKSSHLHRGGAIHGRFLAGIRVPRPVGARVPRARLVGRSPRDRRMTQARTSGRKGAKPLRIAGAWPRPPGLPGHPGVSGGCGALITRQQLTGAKHPSACEPPILGCLGCPGCPGRPLSNGIPCGRPVNWKWHPPRTAHPHPAHQPSTIHPLASAGGCVAVLSFHMHATLTPRRECQCANNSAGKKTK